MSPVASASPVDEDLADACGEDHCWICERVYDATGNPALSTVSDWFVGVPLTIIGILIAAWIIVRIVRRYVTHAVRKVVAPDRSAAQERLRQLGIDDPEALISDEDDQRAEGRAHSIALVVGSTATVVIWTLALLLVLGELGINLGPLIAGAGIAGVALGFGAQSLVKDCLAGLFVLIEDQYGIGDVIDVDVATGTVEEVSLRATVLRGLDGTVWHVPNGEVQRVGNLSMLWSVALIDVDVAYDSDLERARTVMLDTANEVCTSPEWSDDVLDEPTVLGVEVLGADGITMRLIVKTTPGSQWALQRTLREAFKAALDDAGIEIPFPQRTVWMRSEPG